MTLRLNGSTSGYTEIDAPAVAGNNTITFPTTSGTAVINGANSAIVSGTAQNSTSGTSIDFTGIPSWVKRITVMFSGVSLSGTSNLQIQIGSGSFVTTGYTSSAYTSNNNNLNITSGFLLLSTNAASYVMSGHVSLTIANSSSNLWVQSSVLGQSTSSSASGGISYSGGNLALSGTLDRVRITTVSGTDTFDAGSINILYE